jgi:hypothetical protein
MLVRLWRDLALWAGPPSVWRMSSLMHQYTQKFDDGKDLTTLFSPQACLPSNVVVGGLRVACPPTCLA